MCWTAVFELKNSDISAARSKSIRE
jgi:hypothetical protein